MKLLILIIFLVSCSNHFLKSGSRQDKNSYSYTDISGSFRLLRENKVLEKKIVTRNRLTDPKTAQDKVLEKTILVSQIGSIKSRKTRLLTIRPLASEFTVWLEGKKYSSKMQLNPKTKSMKVILDSPESKWQGVHEIKFPKGKYFCFYGQIPECLTHNSLLTLANNNRKNKYDFYIVWEGYPFIQDQLVRIGHNLFTPATLKFDGEIKGQYRYIIEAGEQMMLYHLTKSYEFVKMAWIAQGITVVSAGEEVADDE